MTHVIVSEAEEILDKEFRCLDFGFVRLVDYMGGDESVVQAARVSYGKGTKRIHEDRGLIRYLMRHQHTTPFEMVELKWHVKLPIFVARQWIRHRTANVNEYSLRYSEALDEFYIPDPKDIKFQSKSRKQSRELGAPQELQQRVLEILKEEAIRQYQDYKEMNNKGIARELARIGLGVNLYTQWYWKNDLYNTFKFLELRMDDHAQEEIRVYAKTMGEIVKKVVPISYEAFEDYSLNSSSVSRLELKVVSEMLKKDRVLEEIDNINTVLESTEKGAIEVMYCGVNFGKSELREFREKLEKLI